jgi:hypothetical protein
MRLKPNLLKLDAVFYCASSQSCYHAGVEAGDPIARAKLLEARAAAADRRIANMTATMRSEKGRADAAVRMKAKWDNPEIRSRILDGMQKAWDDPETRRGRIARRWSKTQKEE